MKLAINGLGRVGRLVLRQLMGHPEVDVIGVNDLADTRTLAHLMKYDSVHRRAAFPVSHEGDCLILGTRRIPVYHEKRPGAAPFGHDGAQLVLECTGQFTRRAEAALHLQGTVSHVVISDPSEDADVTAVMGLNEASFDPGTQRIISNANGTTHCLASLLKVLDDAFGVEFGLVTTVHAYTNDQRILDLPHSDLRRARAASMSMIPTACDALRPAGSVLPHLEGRLDGIEVRVPAPDVSIVDLSAMLRREASVETINSAFMQAAAHGQHGHLEVLTDEIVSVDLIGSTANCLFDPFLTKAMTPRYAKVFGWFDNELGYATHLADLAIHTLKRLQEVAP